MDPIARGLAAKAAAQSDITGLARRARSLGSERVPLAPQWRGRTLGNRRVSLWEMTTVLQGQQMFSGGYGQDIDLFIDSAAGSDSNSGSFLAPKQTLAGISAWLPGQVVALKRGGVYRTSAAIDMAAAGCALIAYGSGAPPVVLGSPAALTSGWANVSGNVYSRSAPAGIVNLFKVSTYVLAGITKLTKNTSTPTTPGAGEWGVSGATLYVNSTVDPNTVTFEYSITPTGGSPLIQPDGKYNLVQDVAAFCWSDTGIQIWANADFTTVRGCDSAFNSQDGIDGYSGSTGNPKGFVVEWNRAWYNGYNVTDTTRSGGDGDGISFHGSSNGTDYASGVIRFNDVRYNRKSGIGNQSAVVVDVYSNYSESNFDCFAFYPSAYSGGVSIRQRFWSNIGIRQSGDARGLNLGTTADNTHAIRVEAYHNTFYSTATDNVPGNVSAFAIPPSAVHGNLLTLVARNNIGQGFARGISNTGKVATIDWDYNLLAGNTANYFDNAGNTAASMGLSAAHDVNTSASMVAPGLGGDFRLGAASPGIGAGVDVTGTIGANVLGEFDLVDFRRRALASGSADIGAHQPSA